MKRVYTFLHDCEIGTSKLTKIVLLYLGISVLTLAQPEVLRRATAAITSQDLSALWGVLILAGISAVLLIALTYWKDVSTRSAENFFENSLGSRMLLTLSHTKMAKLDGKQFGDISTAIIRNVELYVEAATNAVTNASAGYFALVLTFIYMCVVQWQLVLCVLFYNLVIRMFAVFVQRKIKRNSMELTAAMKQSGNELISQLCNMLTVRIYSNRDFFKKRFESREDAVRRISWKSFVWSNGFQDFIWAFSKLAEFLIVYGVGAILIFQGLSDVSILMTFVFANDLFTIGINSLSLSMQLQAEAEAYCQSMKEILEETELESEPRKSFQGAEFPIQFDRVSFAYGEKQVLKNVSFTINPGEHVLLQGPNGQGKSTILKLLSGLYRPQGGRILFGEQDIRNVNLHTLTKTTGYISQHSHLLEGDVFENLALSDRVEENRADEVLEELKLSHCKHTDPQSLSMGEQQRLNIGRTLYREDYNLLLCDEIFSNVDKENRQTVIDALNHRFSKATVIMVSHETVPYRFDRVLTVRNGTVSEVEA